MPRVLHVGPCNARGGMATVMRTLAEHPPEGWSADLLPTYSEGGIWAKWRAYRQARQRLKEQSTSLLKPDIVHIHTASDWSWRRKIRLASLATKLDMSVLIHLHSGKFHVWARSWFFRRDRRIRRLIERHSAKFVVLTEEWRSNLTPMLGHIEVVSNPIDAAYQPSSRSRDTHHLLLLGRDDTVKGHNFAISLADQLIQEFPLLKLSLTGRNSSTTPHVHALGWVTKSQKIELLQTATVLLLPSKYEGQPMVALEAAACGLQILANDHLFGLPETAKKVPFNIDSWLDAVRTILTQQNQDNLIPSIEHSMKEIQRRWGLIYGSMLND